MKRIIIVALVVFCTGCANSTGWRFEIGISPVKSLSNTAGLKQVEEKPSRERY
jgi:hypothetical protein